MRPLQAVGMGLVIVVLTAPAGGSGPDVLPDPIGWLLVALGVRRLPATVPLRGPQLVLAALAGVVSAVVWWPGTARLVGDLDASLRWTLELPRIGAVGVIALGLARAASLAGDTRAGGWWRVVLVAATVTALLPAAVLGAGVAGLAGVAGAVAIATLVGCVVLCFAHAGRAWAGGEQTG